MNNWETLFDQAMTCLQSIAMTGSPLPDWTFGGGTALMLRYRHRNSQDIDLFLLDPQWLPILSPERNERIESLVMDYEEGPTWLKLVLPLGEIDFIVAPALTSRSFELTAIHNQCVAVETPAEIIAKKLHYRGAALRSRDLVDLAVVADRDPTSLWVSRSAWIHDLEAIRRRLDQMTTRYQLEAPHLDLLPEGERYRHRAWDIAQTFVERVYAAEQDRKQPNADNEYEPD